MKSTMTAIALALGTLGLAAPAAATTVAQEAAAAEQKQLDISKGARDSIAAMKTAFDAKDWATFDAGVEPAIGKAEKADDTYYIGNLLLNAGLDRSDFSMQVRGVDLMAQSGWDAPANSAAKYEALGRNAYAASDYATAQSLFEKALALAPNDAELLLLTGEALNHQGQGAQAVATMQRGIALQAANGGAIDENWYRRTIQVALDNNLQGFNSLLIDWVKAYPTSENWRDALKIYQDRVSWSDEELVNLWRLMRTAQALRGDRDHFDYALHLLDKGLPVEAGALVEEGVATGRIEGNTQTFTEILALVERGSQNYEVELDQDAAGVRSGGSLLQTVKFGDAYYGMDRFGDAAEFYQLAMSRSGADASMLNLRLGAALARDGQYDAAKAALGQVEGKFAELAAFWMAWIDVQG
ncbi:tetratricopeptide repeat protein [Sphingomicrobium arenosum]|uniref:tetratricopeptide repeat protein n=1 Tax=Sphingomicrobium arenosum TaxID=2233861 RepID=UPI00223FCF02|nr:tetratricopeptide repeat protein [Sphingomicrobium arenosum]